MKGPECWLRELNETPQAVGSYGRLLSNSRKFTLSFNKHLRREVVHILLSSR